MNPCKNLIVLLQVSHKECVAVQWSLFSVDGVKFANSSSQWEASAVLPAKFGTKATGCTEKIFGLENVYKSSLTVNDDNCTLL